MEIGLELDIHKVENRIKLIKNSNEVPKGDLLGPCCKGVDLREIGLELDIYKEENPNKIDQKFK